MWKKQCRFSPRYRYTVTSDRFTVEITGGSVVIKDAVSGEIRKCHSGFQHLYTGDISPDESRFFALENGKHFYAFHLPEGDLVKRVTLPRGYESIDVYGFYDADGAVLNIPAQKWISIRGWDEGYYERVLFRYETEAYTLLEKRPDDAWEAHCWNQEAPELPEEPDPDDPLFRQVYGEVSGLMEQILSRLSDGTAVKQFMEEPPQTEEDVDKWMKWIFGDLLEK